MARKKKTPRLRKPEGASHLVNLNTYDVVIAMIALLIVIWALF